jgi:hypothetical protein
MWIRMRAIRCFEEPFADTQLGRVIVRHRGKPGGEVVFVF